MTSRRDDDLHTSPVRMCEDLEKPRMNCKQIAGVDTSNSLCVGDRDTRDEVICQIDAALTRNADTLRSDCEILTHDIGLYRCDLNKTISIISPPSMTH